ncbi:MAG: uracil-DNA glycosylase, partial [Candidatus Hodarchaeales archaeon]
MLSRDSKRFKYMLIGEAPGRQENESGKVFVGKAGQLLKEAIQTIGLADFFITNILKCRPPENRNPSSEETELCRDW